MNLEELKTQLENAVLSGKISLSGRTLGSEDITNLLTFYCQKDILEIFEIVNKDGHYIKKSGDKLEIWGKANLFNLYTKITVVIGLHDSLPEITLILNLPKSWNFPISFPRLESPQFRNLEILDDSRLILTSSTYTFTDGASEENFSQGLYFIGRASVSGIFDVLKPLLPNYSEFSLFGQISSIDPVIINLTGVLPNIHIGKISLTEAKLKFITQTLELSPNSLRDDDTIVQEEYLPIIPKDWVVPKVEIEGVISIGNTVSVRVYSELPIVSKSLFLRAILPDGVHLPSLADLATLTGEANLLKPLPEDLKNFGSQLDIKEVSFFWVIDKHYLHGVQIKISSRKEYNLFQGLFPKDIIKTEILEFSWFVDEPFKSPETSYAINGQITIEDNYKVDIQIQNDTELYLFIGLAKDTSVELETLIRHFFPGLEFFPHFTVETFSISARPNSKVYNLSGLLKGHWEIIKGIEICELEVELHYDANAETKISGKISGSIIVGGFQIFIETIKQSQEPNGWKFSGSTGSGIEIPIGTLIDDIATKFGDVTLPNPITGLNVEDIRVSLNTKSKDFTFTCQSSLNINEALVTITPDIALTHQQDGSFQKHFGGKIAIADLYFDLSFDRDPNSKTFIATYNNPTGKSQDIKKLAEKVSSAIASFIPKGLTITLKDALFAYSATSDNQTKLLFIFHIDNGINLSSLPLVGKLFPPNQTIQLNYQILAASDHFSTDDVTQLKTLVTKDIFELPTKDIGKKGLPFFGLAVTVQLGDAIEQLNLPILVDSSSNQTTPTHKTTDSNSSKLAPTNQTTASVSNDASLTNSEGVKWSFGPVHFQKIGVKFQHNQLWFLLDASLATSGLTISLDGLSVSSPLTELKPEFHLSGLGIDYRSDTIEIGGTLLKYENEYVGAAILRTQTKKGKSLTLSALGSYTDNKGHPSLFVYALLDYPLGGAPFLFITGLAAAFGYNRTLRLPDKVQDVAQFPLVKSATERITDIEQVRKDLSPSIPPATGEIFFAVGIKFTSFKIIDSFALLTVQLGNRSEINILGLSTLIAPPQIDPEIKPVAKAQLAFRATYLPDEGFLKAEAALLPGAYLFSDKCHLIGQFAFYSWFSGEHEGDFVLTLGGYHPDFEVPEHYPKLPRLQLNWQVDEKTLIKGDAYFALCAHALMAGGHLDITYESGNVKAWLRTEANFLIAWKPYHYDAHIHVTIGASYTYHLFGTHHISGEVGADLHLWGPDFGGKATIKLEIFQIDINFGSSSSSELKTIEWKTFKESFLPKHEEVCSIAVQSGLVRKVGNDKSNLGVINPKHFSLVTNSVIPSKDFVIQGNTQAISSSSIGGSSAISIGSMGVLSKYLTSTHTIKITKSNKENVDEHFEYIPILKKVPVALWGEPPSKDKPLMPDDVNSQQFIENALSGFEIKPKQQPGTGETHAIVRSQLQFSTDLINNAYQWELIKTFVEEKDKNIQNTILDNSVKNIQNTILKKEVKTAREDLLKALNLDVETIDISESIANEFLVSPKVGSLV